MQAYKVVGRSHRRVSLITQQAIAPDGTRMEVKQNGPLVTYGVGDVIEDIRPDELLAFPDRFVAATAAEVDAWHEQQAHLPMVMRAPGLSAEQALEHAELTKQIAALQAQQQALLTQAQTPVPTALELGEGVVGASMPPPGRRSENVLPGSAIADAPGHHSLPPNMAVPPAVAVPPAAPAPPVEAAPAASKDKESEEEPSSPSSSRRR